MRYVDALIKQHKPGRAKNVLTRFYIRCTNITINWHSLLPVRKMNRCVRCCATHSCPTKQCSSVCQLQPPTHCCHWHGKCNAQAKVAGGSLRTYESRSLASGESQAEDNVPFWTNGCPRRADGRWRPQIIRRRPQSLRRLRVSYPGMSYKSHRG